MILMIKAKDRKKKKNNLVNRIGTEEKKVHGKEVERTTQILSASNVASMTIMQRTVT